MTEKEKLLNDAVYNTALAAQGAEKPQYAGTFEGQLNDIFNKIQNREKFSYDVNADPLYQNYKDQYIQGGKLAMKDTMGQAAALTGGYGNTYGQQVGQQAYDAYLQNLSAVIPELYGVAYNQYKDEGDQLKDLYGLVGQQRDAEYGMYRDALGDWERGQAVLRDLEAQEHDRRLQAEAIAREQERYDYQKVWDEEQREYERGRYAEQTAYDREQEAAAIQRALEQQEYQRRTSEEQEAYERQRYNEQVGRQLEAQEYERRMAAEAIQRQLEQQEYERQQKNYSNLYNTIAATGYYPSDAELQAAGMSRGVADSLRAEYQNQKLLEDIARSAVGGGGSSGGGSGRSSGGGGGGYYDYDDSVYDNYYQEETYYPAEYERYLRNTIAEEKGVTPNRVTAGEVGWNDTSKMLNTLGITSAKNTTPTTTTKTTTTTVTNTAAQMAAEAAERARKLLEQQKQKGNGGR